ncbi:hypothetical protein [Halobaculum sp. CBA1158]|nr:hypothetical protein [Halobaculum sp. CBA1158]
MAASDEPVEPLVQALNRKVNHQADRIDDLEERLAALEEGE